MNETTDQKPKVEYRKDIYKLFERLIGRSMTDEEHSELKKYITSYVELVESQLAAISKGAMERNIKIKEMAKVLYAKGQDAEVLEKNLLFLKRLFESDKKPA